jgi:hypothetical protein|tara:strand:+ start:960 stop:1364 length:405 start_codon:yes stop_codon:yes gene_type:complete
MTALSTYAERKVLDLLFKNTSFTAPQAYIGLFTSDPTDSASGTEASGSGYARIRIDNKMSSATANSDNSQITNSSAITFAAASGGAFGTITHIGIFDASSSGNLLAHGALAVARTITDGDTFQINASGLVITID